MKYHSTIALLGGIIDYAGTFPPAALSLPATLAHATLFRRKGKHPWLMGRLTLALTDLKRVDNRLLYDAGADGSAWVFTALGSAITTSAGADFIKTIEWDLREIKHWEERRRESSLRQLVVGYETKLPAFQHSHETKEWTSQALDRFQAATSGMISPYFEVSLEGDWQNRLQTLAQTLSSWLDDHDAVSFMPGIKVRTGGQVIPSAEQLAEVLLACTSHGLRFKATQGLHEAVTHGKSFGFVNLFAAINLLQSLGAETFNKAAVIDCLMTEEAKSFVFQQNQFSFKNYQIENDAIEASRRIHGATFGSCSVEEPDDSLAKVFSIVRS